VVGTSRLYGHKSRSDDTLDRPATPRRLIDVIGAEPGSKPDFPIATIKSIELILRSALGTGRHLRGHEIHSAYNLGAQELASHAGSFRERNYHYAVMSYHIFKNRSFFEFIFAFKYVRSILGRGDRSMEFDDYDDLSKLLDDNGGVISCEMRVLRDAHGVAKLGVNVVANISEALDHRGLGHYPDPLPISQSERARIYRRSSPVGQVIRAAEIVDQKNDEVLRGIAGNTSEAIIKKIRELVCD
jgi:hypothetical protein